MAEIGVWRGHFAEAMLAGCDQIEHYCMIDPWRHLPDWNKPANAADATFERIKAQALASTDRFAAKRRVLHGTTTEVIGTVPDRSLDAVYIDGDHTLRGITIDLVRAYPKVREGGWIGGDDFCPSIWQHWSRYEPTLVFPFAVHFAEAMNERLFALPFRQFLIHKNPREGFAFVDLTGHYGSRAIGPHLGLRAAIRRRLAETLARLRSRGRSRRSS